MITFATALLHPYLCTLMYFCSFRLWAIKGRFFFFPKRGSYFIVFISFFSSTLFSKLLEPNHPSSSFFPFFSPSLWRTNEGVGGRGCPGLRLVYA